MSILVLISAESFVTSSSYLLEFYKSSNIGNNVIIISEQYDLITNHTENKKWRGNYKNIFRSDHNNVVKEFTSWFKLLHNLRLKIVMKLQLKLDC